MTDGWVGPGQFVIPDAVEPIIGYRSWAARAWMTDPMEDGERMLTSVMQPVWWPKHEPLRARHIMAYDKQALAIRTGSNPGIQFELAKPVHVPEECPSDVCQCGIYAWAEPRGLDEDYKYYLPGAAPRISGRVKLWGHVIVHERGYRAQFAQVDGIYPGGHEAEVVWDLAARYQVPVL